LQKALLARILSAVRRQHHSDKSIGLDRWSALKYKRFFSMKLSFPRHTAFPRYIFASVVFSLLILIGAPLSEAQDQDEVIRTETNLVQLNVGVVDNQGHAITSLSRNDFTVYEDGVKQQILHFDPASAPFSLVLLLDVSGSTLSFRPQFKQAALRFLDALAPDDRVSVIQFNEKVKLLTGFTTDRDKTGYAIDKRADGAGETHFYDALKFALAELEKEGRQRRKAIVVLTDGLDTELRNLDRPLLASVQNDQDAITAIDPKASNALNAVLSSADRQGVSIFPLALPSGDPKRLPLRDPVITGIYSAARARMQILADRTGGRLNDIQRLDQMARLYAEVAAELRTLYTVAYQPAGERARNGKWHEIKIEVAHPELIVRTRPGYFAR
jgi:Ca-activated chloride channel family protein